MKTMYKIVNIFLLTLISILTLAEEKPNILLIIADDMGVDALNGYDIGTVLPNTPNIDKLRENGLTFTNVWAAPACAPTRAAILTGKYGVNSGINTVPGILKPNQKSLFKEMNELTNNAYEISVIGKWHNGVKTNIEHPILHGADDFMGVIGAGVEDYFNWKKVENHVSSTSSEYATSYFTDYAANWINQQSKPWFMWMAQVSPHTPFHVPPTELFTSEYVNSNQQKFISMIEAFDYEIGRLLDSIPQNILDNTVIMFVGDNGTPGNLVQGFPKPKGKNTVYQGGIHVPMIISGKGVTRINEKENALINVSDLYATIAQIAQPNAFPENKVNDSYSFKHLLSGNDGQKRTYNYMELGASQNVPTDVYTIRNMQYKIIYDVAGNKEFFDLIADPFEANNLLLGVLGEEQKSSKLDLEQQMRTINSINFETESPIDTIVTATPTDKYPIVDTKVKTFYNNGSIISAPVSSEAFYGQDAQYYGNQPSYTNNGDGTITDNITGLMWEKSMGDKIIFDEAFDKADNSNLGTYTDWRVPTIKELYSLILFSGQVKGETAIKRFIDTDYFDQLLGDESNGERQIDAQTWSSTEYVGKTMNADATVFGVNFIDGRIKGYPKFKKSTGSANSMYFRMVRGNTDYGKNNFEDNKDGTISDEASMLMWQTADDGIARNWEESLAYAEGLELAGHGDWRLPNAKELQSIVDYSRSPQTTNSPAINPLFQCTEIADPDGNVGQYPFYWTSTTHMDGANPYSAAVYIAFGEGQGKMNNKLMDVHGAGCQRSDPKSGNINEYPKFFGPQGDVQYVYNYVRCVRDISLSTSAVNVPEDKLKIYPNPASNFIIINNNNLIENISIYTIQGQKLIDINAYLNHTQVNTSKLTSGIYFIKVKDDLGKTFSQKIVVKK